MSNVLDEPHSQSSTSASDRLRSTMAAARLSFNWLGVRKSLTSSQKDQAANSFGAEGKFLSAGKKLLDTAHPAFRPRIGSLRHKYHRLRQPKFRCRLPHHRARGIPRGLRCLP